MIREGTKNKGLIVTAVVLSESTSSMFNLHVHEESRELCTRQSQVPYIGLTTKGLIVVVFEKCS